MWIDNEVYKNDLESIINDTNIDWKLFKDKTILITGATGLIGSNLINALLYVNDKFDINCRILAFVRNIDKASKKFEVQRTNNLVFIEGDIRDKIVCNEDIDYVIHAASQTASKKFVEDSVNTIDVALRGTKNVLELAKEKNVASMVFLSTMEVYGRPQTDEKISETHSTNLDTTEIRNCYPISKRMCENLCVCYNVNTKIARLTQTFGPGVEYNDERVFAQFARSAIENKDIILHTKGETKRCYLYTADAVRAIFTILLKGENGQAYNVANEDTYCSIYEMAQLVAKECANDKIKVICEVEENIQQFGYAPKLCMNLDTNKLKGLGCKENYNLVLMFQNMIKVLINK
ncbi:MAG: NAD-dependent epimerase/dehydratase family protein [Clostridia bacterium]|nr:NAD-dependent epimerase/dehydratase family protein [Clostridia bacterium]